MDNNNNFEQQFTQNVKSVTPVQSVAAGEGSSKLPLIISIVLGAVTLIESIILVVTLVNFFQVVNPTEEEINADVEEYDTIGDDDEFVGYNDDDEVDWLNLTCTNEETGNQYVLTQSKSFQKYENSSLVNSGSYAVFNDSLISLSGDEGKVLFFDGYSIADGLTVYDCDFDLEESVETDVDTKTEE